MGPAVGVSGSDSRLTFMGIWADFNDDGLLDLYVSVDFGDDKYYENDGLGGFDDVSTVAGITNPEHGMGIAVGDPNLDGCLDVVVTNNTQGSGNPTHEPTFVNLGNCNGVFTFNQAGILDRDTVEWGIHFVDFDNDMDEDLSIVAGGLLSFGEPNALYENDGSGNFTEVTLATGTADGGAAYGSAWADYDNDGDLDWFVANNRESNKLFRNDGPTGNHLVVELEGVTSNGFGIGARVTLVAGGVTQIRQIQAGESYLSTEQPIAFFGIGVEDHATSIRVDWPGGTTDEVFDVSGNQTVRIRQGDGIIGDACLLLHLSYTGMGSDPVAAPTNSVDCALGEFHPGEAISLAGAVPAESWEIGGWTGTSDDASTSGSNSTSMPGSGHTVTVHYLDPSIPDTLVLTEEVVAEPTVLEACTSITVGPNVEITADGGVVVLRSPRVEFVGSVSVALDAALTVEAVSPVGCPL